MSCSFFAFPSVKASLAPVVAVVVVVLHLENSSNPCTLTAEVVSSSAGEITLSASRGAV